MLDRTQAPAIHPIKNISLPEIEVHNLTKGRKLYINREHNTRAFKIEILCDGGNIASRSVAEVQLSLKMLNEGTQNRNSHQVSEYIDSLGSFLEITPGFDNSSISIYGLKKFFKENVEILSEILYQPSFNKESLKSLKSREKNKLKLNLEKGSYLSSINLRKTLYGDHPYGYILSLEDIDRIQIDEISQFHKNIKSFDIYLSGDLPAEAVELIQARFNENSEQLNTNFSTPTDKSENVEQRNVKYIQSSIKLGRKLFNRSHSDYFNFIVTNEVLGGFFGSRLMKNIREDKGFTYGIYSSLYPLKHSGYFLISTDVKGANEADTLNEVRKEIDLLRSTLVPESELHVVKNYMIGTFVNSFSTPFAAITKFKTLNSQSLSFSFYERYIENVKAVSPEQIQETALKYLDFDDLIQSIIGA